MRKVGKINFESFAKASFASAQLECYPFRLAMQRRNQLIYKQPFWFISPCGSLTSRTSRLLSQEQLPWMHTNKATTSSRIQKQRFFENLGKPIIAYILFFRKKINEVSNKARPKIVPAKKLWNGNCQLEVVGTRGNFLLFSKVEKSTKSVDIHVEL